MYSDRNAENDEFNNELKRLLSSSDKVFFVDPSEYLCKYKGGTRCRNFDLEMKVLFSDRANLSIYGSEYMISQLEPLLLDLLNVPDGE